MCYGSSIAVSYGVGRRLGLDPLWLWLRSRLAATARIPPLAWEPLYALGAAPKRPKKKKKKKVDFELKEFISKNVWGGR